MNSLQLITAYLGIINIIAFIFMWSDKQKSKKHAFRTPEAVFFVAALMGGSVGSIAGMYLCRHKTRHWYFVVFMPLILIAQLALVAAIYYSPLEIVFR